MEGSTRAEVCHGFETLQGEDCPDEHGSRITGLAGDAVEQPVSSVCEIHISMSRRAVHDTGAGGEPGTGMAGQVCFTVVGFGFDDTSRKALNTQETDQFFTKQVTGDFQNRPAVKILGEEDRFGHHNLFNAAGPGGQAK